MTNRLIQAAKCTLLPFLLTLSSISAGAEDRQENQKPTANLPAQKDRAKTPEALTVFSADRTWFATAGQDGKIRYGPTAEGMEMRTLDHCRPIALVFSPDATLLASVGQSCGKITDVKIWRLNDRQLLDQFALNVEPAPLMAFSRDARFFACTSTKTRVIVRNIQEGRVETARTLRRPAKSFAFTPDNSGLIIQCAGDNIETILLVLPTLIELSPQPGRGDNRAWLQLASTPITPLILGRGGNPSHRAAD